MGTRRGTIDGETTQNIEYGKDATSVTAVPDELYEFLRWSDNITTATRTDKNIIQNMNIFALFEKSGILIDPSRTNYCEQTFMDLVPNQIITFSYYKIKHNCFSSCYIRFSFELFEHYDDEWKTSSIDLSIENWIKKENYYYSVETYSTGDIILDNISVRVPSSIAQQLFGYKISITFEFLQSANIALTGTTEQKIETLEILFD